MNKEINNQPSVKIKEIEVKYRLNEEAKKRLLSELAQKKVKLKKRETEIDIYYSRPDKDFMKTRECLRIRYTSNYAELTYKPGTTEEMLEENKFWKKEVTLVITGQIELVKELLRDLEYIELVKIEKERETYQIFDVILTIDHIKELGWFSELEVQSDDEVYALETIESYAAKFGLREEDLVSEPYRDLLMKHLAEQK